MREQVLFPFAACSPVIVEIDGRTWSWPGCGRMLEGRPTGDRRLAALCGACAEEAAAVLGGAGIGIAGPRQLGLLD